MIQSATLSRTLSAVTAAVICLFYLVPAAWAEPKIKWTYDPTFRLKGKPFAFRGVPNEDQKITRMLQTPDGGIVVVGAFTGFKRVAQRYVLKLKPDLSLDTTFAPAINGAVLDAALTLDGKLFIGGDFSTVDGISRPGFARLLGSGALDTSFDPQAGANGSLNNVTRVIPFSDGSLALFGNFSRVQGRLAQYSVAKVTSGGLLDTDFMNNLDAAGLSSGTYSISLTDTCELMPEDRLLVLGFGTDSSNSDAAFEGAAIINSDGTRTESVKDASTLVNSQRNARGFSRGNGSTSAYISHAKIDARFKPLTETLYRFDTTGSVDTGFQIQKKGSFNSVAIEQDGTFLVAPQTVRISVGRSGKATYSARSLINHYSVAGQLLDTFQLPGMKGKAFEYKNLLPLPDGSLLVQVRTITLSKRAGTGCIFKNFLIKVKPAR